MGGGAWPFLVGGVICLLNCDNARVSRRWRAQQNAKRDANCRNSWVITFLNAIGTQAMSLGMNEGVRVNFHLTWISREYESGVYWIPLFWNEWYLQSHLKRSLMTLYLCTSKSPIHNLNLYPSSFHSRLPAEFKHINQRWKRNQLGYPQ